MAEWWWWGSSGKEVTEAACGSLAAGSGWDLRVRDVKCGADCFYSWTGMRCEDHFAVALQGNIPELPLVAYCRARFYNFSTLQKMHGEQPTSPSHLLPTLLLFLDSSYSILLMLNLAISPFGKSYSRPIGKDCRHLAWGMCDWSERCSGFQFLFPFSPSLFLSLFMYYF